MGRAGWVLPAAARAEVSEVFGAVSLQTPWSLPAGPLLSAVTGSWLMGLWRSGSTAAGTCWAPSALPRSSASGGMIRPRIPGSCCPPSPCAGCGWSTAGQQLSGQPTAGGSWSRRHRGRNQHRLRCPCSPGRWGKGCLLLPSTALPAAAGSCWLSWQSSCPAEPSWCLTPRPATRYAKLFWRQEQNSKESPTKWWERAGKGLPKGLLTGCKAANQPHGLPTTYACLFYLP